MRSSIFFQLSKVDEAKRLVYGIATAEVADKAGEILDYASSVPYFKKWSSEIEKASGGKSLGNVREMHDEKAVGKLTELNCDDETKAISVCAKIVEESTWQKVLEGVLTGFSIGGDYVKKWKDSTNAALTRFTAEPSEISVVDNPCVGIATFAYMKSDGSIEMRKLNSVATVVDRKAVGRLLKQVWSATDGKTFDNKDDAVKHQATLDAATAASNIPAVQKAQQALADINKQLDGMNPMYWETDEWLLTVAKAINNGKVVVDDKEIEKREFSDAKRKEMAGAGEAMSDGSYPIASPKDVENAVHDWGRTGSKDSVKQHIMSRAKAIGAESELPSDWSNSKKSAAFGDLEKAHTASAYDASAAMEAIHRVLQVLMREEMEVKRGDSEDAAQVAMLEAAVEKLKEFVASEIKEKPEADEGSAEKAVTVMVENAETLAKVFKEIVEQPDSVSEANRMQLRELLEKAGRRHSAADEGKLAMMHDHVDDMGDHLDKMRKMHKMMMDTAEKMGDTTHAEHSKKLGDHLHKMDKSMSKAEATHGEMCDCMKGLGVMTGEKVSAGTLEKLALVDALQSDNEALKKALDGTTQGMLDLAKRLKFLEEQPNQTVKRPALFHVEKVNEVRIDEPGVAPDDQPQANPFGSGLAPGVARIRKQG